MRSIMNGRWAALEGCKSMAELHLVSGLLYHLRQKKKEFTLDSVLKKFADKNKQVIGGEDKAKEAARALAESWVNALFDEANPLIDEEKVQLKAQLAEITKQNAALIAKLSDKGDPSKQQTVDGNTVRLPTVEVGQQDSRGQSEPSASSGDNSAILQMLQSMQNKMDNMQSGMESMKLEVNNIKNNKKEDFELSDCQPQDGKKTDITMASMAAKEVNGFSNITVVSCVNNICSHTKRNLISENNFQKRMITSGSNQKRCSEY